MAARSKFTDLAKTHPQFPRRFAQRVQRGDTNADLQFWIFSRYGVRISDETIRDWRTKHVAN